MFKDTVEQLKHIAAQAQAGALSPVAAGDQRAACLIKAVHEMAEQFEVTLKPIYAIDSRGELLLAAVHPTDSIGCGPFKGFAAWVNQAKPRTGSSPICIIPADSGGWCYLNHFQAERMVLAYADSLQ